MILAGYSNGVSIRYLLIMAGILYAAKSLYENKAKPVNYLSVDDSLFMMYHNLFVADDFILQLCTFEYILEEIKKQLSFSYSSNKNPTFNLEEWLTSQKISYVNFLDASQFIDELTYNFISNGLDPIANDCEPLIHIFRRSFDEGILEVKKIKKCIYEGFRLNLATWSDHGNAYVINQKGLKVDMSSTYTIPRNFEQVQPRNIIMSEYNLQTNKYGVIKISTRGWISVMDGHVTPDLNF
jgi:hypothetical protein